jgi:predicted hydrocarbon binding protein
VSEFPPRDFLELLAFNFDEARIWLGDRRMVMIDVAMFAELRRGLIDGLGREEARKLFVRLGFESGLRDARALVERWPSAFEQADKYGVMSPHRFQGITKLDIVSLSRDAQGLIEAGEWQWLHSAEADAHMNAYGRATEPVCWMELGYGTGYGLGLRGRLNVYQEVGCRAMGHEVCTVIGKDLTFYEDAEAYIEYFDFLKPYVESLQLPRPKVASARRATVVPAPAEPVADAIVGHSPALAVAKQLLESVASSSATVLITGESGVGKELFTRNLHRLSARANKPFVAVSCAAIPESLIEAELFGVERGAYTGAIESRAGRFERADGGTLFLDEIG